MELEDLLNKTTRDYYLMTICDLQDGNEVSMLEKACEDMFEDGEYAMAIGIWWAIQEYKTDNFYNTLINGKTKEEE